MNSSNAFLAFGKRLVLKFNNIVELFEYYFLLLSNFQLFTCCMSASSFHQQGRVPC